MQKMPWYRAPRFEEAFGRRLDSLFSGLKTWKTSKVTDSVRLEYLYERDRFTVRNGGYKMPRWVLEEYGWLADQDVAAPRINLVKSRVDTLTSLLLSSQPAIEIRSSGAGYEEQRVARSREAALEGTLNTDAAKEQLRLIGRDGLISNFGACMPVVRGDELHFERLRLDQLYWDPHDARRGKPKSMHLVEYSDRDDFLAWYKGLDAKAMGITNHDKRISRVAKMEPVTRTRETETVETPYDWEIGSTGLCDSTERLRVVHSWRVATSALDEDGRYVCTVYGRDGYGCVVIDRPFPRTTLPICWWSPYPPIEGLVGSGYATLLVETQRALDFAMRRLQNRVEKLGWAKLGIGQQVNEEAIENYAAEEITVIRLPGTQDIIQIDTQALSTHDIQWIETLTGWTASFYGINEALASGASNRGASASGLAMYEESDRQIDRLSDIYESWQNFRLRVAQETLNAIEDAVRQDPKFRTSYKDLDGNLVTEDWADHQSPHGSYSLQVEEAGELGRTRAARMAKILEGAKLGIFTPDTAAAAVQDSPDLRRLNRMANAPRRAIERQLGILIKSNGDWDSVQPSSDLDLALAVKMCSDQINDAMASGAKPETIERLREYRRNAESELQRIQAEQQAAQVAMAASTQAAGDLTTMATDAQAAQMMAQAGVPGGGPAMPPM